MKGRHPLLKDVDVNINPSQGLAILEGREPNKGNQIKIPLNVPGVVNINEHSLNNLIDKDGESDIAAGLLARSLGDLERNSKDDRNRVQEEKNKVLQETSSYVAEVVKEEVINPVDNDRGQVLQTTEVVMNMLDATIPDTLTEEEKKKVMVRDSEVIDT